MTHSEIQEHRIREYLLGHLDEERASTLERELLSNQDLWEMGEIVDSELIEADLAGELTDAESRSRAERLLASEAGRRRVSFFLALRKASKASVEKPVGPRDEPLARVMDISSWWQLAPLSARALAAAFSLALVGLSVLLGTLLPKPDATVGPAVSALPSPDMLSPIKSSYVLRPISRDSNKQPNIHLPPELSHLELWLLLPGSHKQVDARVSVRGEVLAEFQSLEIRKLAWGTFAILELPRELVASSNTSFDIFLTSQEVPSQRWSYSASIFE